MRSVRGGKSLCSVYKQGKLRVTSHSIPDVPEIQIGPEQQEMSIKHGSAQKTQTHASTKTLLSDERITRHTRAEICLFYGISL